MAMSALVKEQIEGIAPIAISMIPPDKFSVSWYYIKQLKNIYSMSSGDLRRFDSVLLWSFSGAQNVILFKTFLKNNSG